MADNISRSTLMAQKERFVQTGKGYLDRAAAYLHANCDNWQSRHETYYRELLHKAEVYCIRASVLADLLKYGQVID